VVCPDGSTVIGSRLDVDAHAPGCRIAFHGAVRAVVDDADEDGDEREGIRAERKMKIAGGIREVSGGAGIGDSKGSRAGPGAGSRRTAADRKARLGAI